MGYESWLERDHVIALDFDQSVVAIASQPFWLCWHDGNRARRHAPDFFARRADGVGIVVDVRADDRIEPPDAEAFAATQEACAQLGWQFRRVGVIDRVLAGNVRWLSRYRHPRCAASESVAAQLLSAFDTPKPLRAGAMELGDPLAILPALFHLMWCGHLVADLAREPLHSSTLVHRADVTVLAGMR